ncbi:MAG: hypothetical protein QXT86_13730 [Archaeoglobaceae archaeon]
MVKQFFKMNLQEQSQLLLRGGNVPTYAYVPVHGITEDELILRILPPWSSKGLVFQVLPIHWFGKDESRMGVICRRHFRSRCYICEALNNLVVSGVSKDVLKNYYAKNRAFCNAIDVTRPEKIEEGVKIFSLPLKKVALAMLEHAKENGDFTDPEEGYPFKIVRERQGVYPDYKVVPLLGKQKRYDSGIDWDNITLYNLDDFENVFKVHSYEEQKELWEVYSDLVGSVSNNTLDEMVNSLHKKDGVEFDDLKLMGLDE